MKSKCLVCGKEIQIYPWSLAIDTICLDCRLKIWEDIIRFSEAEQGRAKMNEKDMNEDLKNKEHLFERCPKCGNNTFVIQKNVGATPIRCTNCGFSIITLSGLPQRQWQFNYPNIKEAKNEIDGNLSGGGSTTPASTNLEVEQK